MKLRTASKTLSLVLALQIGVLSPFETVWVQNSAAAAQPPAPTFAPDYNLKALQALEPTLQEFAASRPMRSPFLPTPANDPILDQDPYFMRSQEWSKSLPNAGHLADDATAFLVGDRSLSIQLAQSQASLKIHQPLAPVFETQDFLFLRATTAQIFKDKAKDAESYGEGLFFVDKRPLKTELAKTAGDARPVPIYFLPLGGRGWTTNVEALSFGPNDTVAFQNAENDFATVDADQMHILTTICQTNLVMATIMALKNDPAAAQMAAHSLQTQFASGKAQEGIELPFVLPPRGSTAAFGDFFTGVNIDHPEQSIDEIAKNTWSLRSLVLPEANANDVFTPDLVNRLLLIGKVTGTVYLTGLVAQFTVLRNRMLERRALIEKLKDEENAKELKPQVDRKSRLFRVQRAFIESIDVWVHGLNSLSSGATTGSGFGAEYGSDRFLGDAARTDNGLIRRFLKWTFLYNRKQNENIAADARTFYLGSIVLGGIDTAGVTIQLAYVSSHFFPWVAHSFFGPEIQQRIDSQFKGGDAANANNLQSEVLRNFSGYIVNGASSYSSQLRTQFQEVLRPEVRRQFVREGKNPDDPTLATEFNQRMEALLDFTMVSRGLPSRSKFLFSAPTIYRKMAGLLGYRIDGTKSPYDPSTYSAWDKTKAKVIYSGLQAMLKTYFFIAGVDATVKPTEKPTEKLTEKPSAEDAQKPLMSRLNSQLLNFYWGLNEISDLSKGSDRNQVEDTFLFEQARWGVLSHVLKMAQQNALSFVKIFPDSEDAKVALQILEKSKDDFHAIYKILKNPLSQDIGEALKSGYRVRKMLTLLSYEGPVIGDTVKYADLWPESKTHPKAAQMAGRIFRQSLFALTNNKPYYLAPDEEFLKANIEHARAQAEQELQNGDPVVGFNEVDREILALEKVKALYEKTEADKAAAAWRPEEPGFVEKFQSKLASKRAEARSQNRDEYREAYREELAKIVGLHVLPAEQSELVRKAIEGAREQIASNLKSSESWQKYLATLDEEGQFQFLTHQYADAFLSNYLHLTVGNSDIVSLTSNEQPGRFQRVRMALTGGQDNWFKKTLRIAIRLVESPMNNSAYRPGFGSLLTRNLPLLPDLWTDIKQRTRTIWVAGTAGYLSQYYIWQVKFQWPTYLFFFSTLSFVAAVSYWLDRMMMNIGVKPMNTVAGKGAYSWFYTWLTYPTYIPFFFFLPYYQNFVMNYVAPTFTKYVSSPIMQHVVNPIVQTCSQLLGGS